MELFIFMISLTTLVETTYLVGKSLLRSQKHQRGHRKLFVDTSALIDGRVLEVAKTGFMSDDFIIPRSVTRELQLLADGKDSEKRKRARDGLSAINALERVVYFTTEIFDDDELGKMPVDERLLTLAREHHGMILTCDYNLCKVAATEHIKTLNVNDLAMVLDFKYRNGDQLHVKISERGNNPGQGVGHLHDGTMIVVDGAADLIGEDIDIRVANSLQTPSGRMIFATLAGVTKPRGIRKRKNRLAE